MQQRVRIPYRGTCPSSAKQLPILAALYAGYPTLFGNIIHDRLKKVKYKIDFLQFFCQDVRLRKACR